jgi:type II secretory pathway component PulJ
MTPPREQFAFTLLEVILAVALSVGVVGAMFALYLHGVGVRDRVQDELDLLLTQRLTMDRMTSELRGAMEFKYLQIGLEGDAEQATWTTTVMPGPEVWDQRVATDAPPPPRSDVQLVGYRLRIETDQQGRKVVTGLERLCQRVLLAEIVTEAEDEKDQNAEIQVELITPAIRYLRYRYWDGQDWVDSWEGGNLPGAVEITLGPTPLDDPNGEPAGPLARRVVHIPAGVRSRGGTQVRGLGGDG